MSNHKDGSSTLTLHISRDELVIRDRYEVASISNDILIGIWFVVGTILMFFPSDVTAGTWLFLIGSVQMLIRPAIRLARRVHLVRVGNGPSAASQDF